MFLLHVVQSQGKYAGSDGGHKKKDRYVACLCEEFMKRDRSGLWMMGAFLPLISSLVTGCSQIPQQPVLPPAASVIEGEPAFSVLAGSWEYEEGTAVVPLEIDRSGVGTYPYKGGRLITDRLDDHHWRGRWHQPENDREGGFEVTLAPDFSEGDGRWWYTRIGHNQTPTEKGGTFHLTRSEPPSGPLPALTAR